MTFYLELFRQGLPKALIKLLEYYDIVDQIFAVCCGTTSSNTGGKNIPVSSSQFSLGSIFVAFSPKDLS